MKKIAEKVALAAQICITLVFVLTLILCMTGTIQTADLQDNKVVIVLFVVLIVVYAALSAYLLYVAFAERENIKRILLYYDNDCATRANAKVVTNIVKGCAKEVTDVKVRKIKLRVDDKQGLIATLYVETAAENIADSLNKLRLLLVDSFKNTLGITFSTINFEIDKLNKKFVPNKQRAEQQEETETTDEQLPPQTDEVREREKTEETVATAQTEAEEADAEQEEVLQ